MIRSATIRPDKLSTSRPSSIVPSPCSTTSVARIHSTGQIRHRQPISQTQPKKHRLLMTLHITKNLIVVNGQHSVTQHVPVGGRVFDIPPPRASNVRMSPRANSPPVVPQPVRHVVSTSVIPAAARTSPVRDLVVDLPSLGENLFGKQVFVSEIVLVSHR